MAKSWRMLNTEDRKMLSASALLDMVSALVPGPIGVTLPIIGNVLLSAIDKIGYHRDHDMAAIQEQVNRMSSDEQEQVKEELLRIGDLEEMTHPEEQERNLRKEIYSVDAVEIIFRAELDIDLIERMQQVLYDYIKGGVDCGDRWLDNEDSNCPVDMVYTTESGAVFNLLDSVTRADVQALLEDVDMLIHAEDCGNQIKSVILY